MRITLREILGSNFETITNALNNSFNIYKDNIQTNNVLKKYVNLMNAKLKIKLKPLLAFQSLYDLETSRAIIEELINDYFNSFMSSSMVNDLMLKENWTDINTIGKARGKNISIQNYEGFSIGNQNGQFSKNTGEVEQTGGSSALQYISFLQSYVDNVAIDFAKRLKSEILQLIY